MRAPSFRFWNLLTAGLAFDICMGTEQNQFLRMNINLSAIPLSELAPGQKALVYAVLGPGKGVQLRLSSLGLRPGANVQVVGRGPGRGPILVEVNGTRVAIGRGLAKRILVLPAQEERP